MTIDRLFEIVRSIEDIETRFKICCSLYPIYKMEKLVRVYNNNLEYLYLHNNGSFSFADDYFYEDDNNMVHSFDDKEDIADNLFWDNIITSDIAERIDIAKCNTIEDIYRKLGIDI